jgi:hypothetical protein
VELGIEYALPLQLGRSCSGALELKVSVAGSLLGDLGNDCPLRQGSAAAASRAHAPAAAANGCTPCLQIPLVLWMRSRFVALPPALAVAFSNSSSASS